MYNPESKMVKNAGKRVHIAIDGKDALVHERVPILEALALQGYPVASMPDEAGIFAPCRTGGCWSCAVQVDGRVKRACVTRVEESLDIKTTLPSNYTPRCIVRGFMAHTSGGVGTPWNLRTGENIEVACFAAGCNFRCSQCQNWKVAYCSRGRALTPRGAAEKLTEKRRQSVVSRMAISGGEPTLNQGWLVAFIRELKRLNPGDNHFHVDTNGSMLTKDYIDELVSAGMTDIGIDLKGLEIKTVMRITGLRNQKLALRYRRNAWSACRYLARKYQGEVFLGIGIPYNKALISMDEIHRMGIKIRDEISPSVQVSVIDYRPEFKSNISRPGYEEMSAIHDLLKAIGLSTIVCHTESGQIAP